MTDSALWAAWWLWMAVAGAVVVVAAALLLYIWWTARRIHADALRALSAAGQILERTQPIWALEETNETAAALLETVRSIEKRGTRLAAALESHAGESHAGAR